MKKVLPYIFDLLIVIITTLIVKVTLSLFSIKMSPSIGIGLIAGITLSRIFRGKHQGMI
ncbi:MAG TPA: hypothetical protein GXX70_04380 [Tepidimicrobium sp.]|nr:hypothetical protein [Tepidimicrobium sp.]